MGHTRLRSPWVISPSGGSSPHQHQLAGWDLVFGGGLLDCLALVGRRDFANPVRLCASITGKRAGAT
jgi:hypothetical protein